MQQRIMNMLESDEKLEISSDSRLSFKPFIDYLRERVQDENTVKKQVLAFVLEKFEAWPELEGAVDLDQLPRFKSLLDLLFVVLTSLTEDEKKVYWGLCVPMTPIMFYGSDPFYKILKEANLQDCSLGLNEAEYQDFIKHKLETFYSFVLKHFYGITYRLSGHMVRSFADEETKLIRHFSLNLNTGFVSVTTAAPLPMVDIEMLRSYAVSEDSVNILQRLLPMSMFSFSGFTILTITDVTQEFALDAIRNYVVTNKGGAQGYDLSSVTRSLKELTGSNDIEFNILPLFKVNGKLIEEMDGYCQSILFTAADRDEYNKIGLALIEKFVANPRLLYYGDLETEGPSQKDAARLLQRAGVKAYGLFPAFYNNQLVGAIEMYSLKKGGLNEKNLSAIEPAKELLAQIIKNSLTAFDDEIEIVIKEKFTSLQPSVQWKFNEVAWHYLQKKHIKSGRYEPDEIGFENVYPIYGAVDIRNSTIERNAALHKDLSIQFRILLKVLTALKEKTGFWLLDEKLYAAKQWADLINNDASLFNQEVKLNDFLELEITPFLQHFTDKQPELLLIASEYFNAVDEQTGPAQENRRQLEHSMSTVISSVNTYFDQLKDEIQQAYPCYFEKFRTDGVEYDIYIGQSLTPDRTYSDIYLKNLRLMQLSSMAAIAKYTHSMLPQLPNPVETTQLIFVHSHPIDIRFRRDEKRFDVEGAYNIRYHIVKKRIDKVHLRGTDERLTQPGKIALVYFNDKEAEEYISYIRYLQGEKILTPQIEYLELEDLQGVAGLKAMRVTVNID